MSTKPQDTFTTSLLRLDGKTALVTGAVGILAGISAVAWPNRAPTWW